MPELPEVETMVRGIRPFVEGRKIVGMRSCRCGFKPISITPALSQIVRRVRGRTIISVRRVAKRIVLEICSKDAIVVEPRMTGLMLLCDPPDRNHLRLRWDLSGQSEYNSLWFWDRRGLGTVRLLDASQLAVQLGPQKLGPDALGMTAKDWRQRCSRTHRPIKVALLDQKLIAGIGNLYASEILHLARIHPAHPSDELKPRQLKRLQKATQSILEQAIICEGSTLNDGTYRNALNQNGRYQSLHRVYNREHAACPSCGAAGIKRIVQAQRSTFFCAACQR